MKGRCNYMKQYTNDEWINIFNEVSTGSVTARQAIKKYYVSNLTYYKMKNKLLPLSPDFREALLINHNSENSVNSKIKITKKVGYKS